MLRRINNRNPLSYSLSILVLLLFFFTPYLYSQVTLRGTVSDSATREPLIGASVALKGTALGSATDREGKYKITRVASQEYVVRISYIGYVTKEFSVAVGSSDTTINAELAADVLIGKEFIVSAQARGQVVAINQQVTSNTIMNVVSEEKIKELPDANAAEAIGRLPGVSLTRSGGEANKVTLRGLSDRFGTITIDGIKIPPTDVNARGVDLSTVSQGTLAGIELFKVLTPDKDGDAIAGSVNLVTKKAPSARVMRLDSKGVYNDLNKTIKQYDFTLRYGERFFDDMLGVQLTGNLEQRDRSNERIDINYDLLLDNGTDYQIDTFFLSYTNEIRKRGGVGVLVDITTPDSGSIKINNVFNSTKRDYITFTRNYPLDGTDVLYGARNVEREITTFNSSIRGENTLFDLTANWGLSFAQSLAEDPYDYSIDFREPSELDDSGRVISGMNNPPDRFKGPLEELPGYAMNNFEKAYFNTGYYRSEKNLDKEKTAFLDVSSSYSFGSSILGELKVGGKYREKDRFKERSELFSPYYIEPFRRYTRLADGTVVLKDFSGTRFENLLAPDGRILVLNFLDPVPESRYLYERYYLYPMMNRDALRLWYELNKNGVADSLGRSPEYRRNAEADGDYYDLTERVSAGYIMNTFQVGTGLTFIAGVRVESEDNEYLSRYSPFDLSGFPTPEGIIKDTAVSFSETVWLPSFHLTLRPLEFMNVRLAAYRALARPDFNHRLESFIARKAGTFYPGNSLTVGNPRLRAAKAWNFEISNSWFGNKIGLFTVSAFYKDIKDMFHLLNGIQIKGTPERNQQVLDSLGILWKAPTYGVPMPEFFLTYPYNSGAPTHVWGFEIEHQANLNFLPGLLQHIVLSYNLSIVRSETEIMSSKIVIDTVYLPGIPYPVEQPRTEFINVKQKLEGQPELFGNASIGYDIGGFSSRISLFYQSEYNSQFSASGRSDQSVDSYTRWDLALKQQLNDHVSLLFNLNNFTNVEENSLVNNRLQGWELLDRSEIYGMTADLGVVITL
ncbi:MAG: TonB-dependent receptor [Bacteroidetes bacterium]|nr:MAG: TonB-dependent receptor [Bacteroidota bacterium]